VVYVGVRCFSGWHLHERHPRDTAHSNWFSPRSARNDCIYQCDVCPCAFVFENGWRAVWSPAILLSLIALVSFLLLDWFGRRNLGGLDQRIFLAATLIWMWTIGQRIQGIAKNGRSSDEVIRKMPDKPVRVPKLAVMRFIRPDGDSSELACRTIYAAACLPTISLANPPRGVRCRSTPTAGIRPKDATVHSLSPSNALSESRSVHGQTTT